MNALSSLSSSYFSPQKTEQFAQAGNVARSSLLSQQRASPAIVDNNVSLSDAGIVLSKRASELGNATADAAKNFLASFVQQLFGGDSAGVQIAFDSSSLSASSQFFAALEQSSGTDGNREAAAIGLKDSADFVGKGQITTADGRRFNFEVEVHYQSIVESAAVSKTSNSSDDNPGLPVTAVPKQQAKHIDGLNAHFPGSVRDLFNLLVDGKFDALFQLPALDQTDAHQHVGKLKFHLLDLVENVAPNVKKINDAYRSLDNSEPSAIAA